MEELTLEEMRRRGQIALDFARELREEAESNDELWFPSSCDTYLARIPRSGFINRLKYILAWLLAP
ncbi:MAG: hypothetical protein A2126_04475 [Candidatus Woykebacteria bacterium GWB1_45_5]|uniref:Uncharacterized protein n=1 Tax=Candidatus Woykebacteria bacterium GWB1_45_5 TaxID=1802592 RepID=A0A1G1W4Y3_9BACT|nr:MAG: hypothetical protein A2126_04475 [Candidatus Woykebacteria bacterium GWB1_45_5]